MNENKKYTIGEISKLCGITPRQLRYYDNAGILKPSYRNPDNSYRYYTEDQIELLIFLSDLKDIGITNDSIQRLFINRDVDQLVQELQINLALVEQEINSALNRYRSLVNALVQNTKALYCLHGDDAISSSNYGQFWISVVQIPKMNILYKRYNVKWGLEDSSDHLSHVIDLNMLSIEQHVKTFGNKMMIFHHGLTAQFNEPDQVEDGIIEIARAVDENSISDDPKCVRSFGGFSCISTIYVGNPAVKKHAYEALLKWAEDHDQLVADSAIEEYMIDSFSSTDKHRFVTRIYLPLKGSQV